MTIVADELLNPYLWLIFFPIGCILSYYIYGKWIPAISYRIVYGKDKED